MKSQHHLPGLLLAMFILLPNLHQAQGSFGLEVEVVTEDIGVLIGALGVTDLTGYSTTRIYVTTENEDDFLSSVSGDATNPTLVNTTTNFYHALLGAGTPNGINSLLFPVYPDLAYDSWVTVGLEGAPNAGAGEANVSTVQSNDNPWLTNFDPGGGQAGGNIAIDDAIGGAWYALNGDANGIAGSDLKVLAGQFTTTGELSGQLYVQVFINGDGSDEFRDTFYIGGGAPILGCTDADACNFDPEATEDDDSCTLAEAGLDCDGNCLEDADMDGICDADEVPGCTDETAINFNADATDDDGSCTYLCGPEWGEPTTYPGVATVLAQITVEGENANMMDAVGAFVGDELRGEADIIEFEGATYVNMTVYISGGEEAVSFALFQQDDCSTCAIDAEVNAMSFGEYGSFETPLMLDANCSATSLDVELTEGWNYVSTNLIPSDYSISNLFDEALGGSLLKVLGDDDFALGNSYTPGIPSVFNSLQSHSDAAGYVIKVNMDDAWTSSGLPIDPSTTPMDLNEGWNIIGYLPQVALAVEDAFQSIDGVVGTVIDGQNGTVWNPANPNEFNSLLNLEPGRSYWVRMIEASTLTYPSAEDVESPEVEETNSSSAAEGATSWDVSRAPLAAAVAAEIQLDEAPISGEAYLGAFVNETCVAVRPVMALGNMSATQMAIMLHETSQVTFKLWVDGDVLISDDVMTLDGGQELGQGNNVLPIIRFGSSANGMVDGEFVSHVSLSPVPASSEAWMNLELEQGGQMEINVFDARGARVATLHKGEMSAGQHRLPIHVGNWASGTYFVQGISPKGVFRSPLIVQ